MKIIYTLKKNGFKRQEPSSYANTVCNVVIEKYGDITVADNDGNEYFAMNFREALGYMIEKGFITDFIS